jgi:hypothetical protein
MLQKKQQPTPSLSLEIPVQTYTSASTGSYPIPTAFSPEQLQTPMSPPALRESMIAWYNSMGMARYLTTDLESLAEDPNTRTAAFSASKSAAESRNIMRTVSANPFEDPYPPTYAESLTHLVQASFSTSLPYLVPPLPSSNLIEKA